MDFTINFKELELVMGENLKCFSDGFSTVKYIKDNGEEKEIRKEVLVSKYIRYITVTLGKKIQFKMSYRQEAYSCSCEAHILGTGAYKSASGGVRMEDMILSSLEGIITHHSKKKNNDIQQ